MVNRRATLLVALVCADGATIGLLRPRLGPLAGHLHHPHAWVTEVGADRALAELSTAALWFAGVWLAVGLLAAVAAWLPGSVGRWAEGVGRALLPRAVRGLIAGSAGLGVLLAPVAAGAATPTGPTGPAGPDGTGPTSSQPTTIPAPAWPQSPAGTPSSDPSRPATPATTSVPAPVWPSKTVPTPTSPTRSAPKIRSTPKTRSTPKDSRKPAPQPQAPSAGPARTSPDDRVQVRAGDCLWLIAARHLGSAASAADIAAEWPRWYAANNTVIGADPAVIQPGEVLQPPPAGT